MAATLATIRDRVETHLSDSTNLTYGTDVLDEAIRSALAEISIVQGTALTLSAQSADVEVQETLTLSIAGTPAQIAGAVSTLEKIPLRIDLHRQGFYPSAQFLRFKTSSTESYFYATLLTLSVQINPDGPRTRQTGSLSVTLVYTRPNYFEGPKTALPLSGKPGTDLTTAFTLYNHTDSDAAHGNYALIDNDDLLGDLPAALRIELKNTSAYNFMGDVMISLFQHPTAQTYSPFFYYAGTFTGGTATANAAAISGYYRTVSWATTTWSDLGYWYFAPSNVGIFLGAAFRPILRFYSAVAYSDLYLKLVARVGTYIVGEWDPIYIDNTYGYAVFPPITMPPSPISWGYDPLGVNLHIYGQHDTAASYSLDFDCLTLFPLASAAVFTAFYDLYQNAALIDDSFLKTHASNMTPSGSGAEIVTHTRAGAPLLVSPHEKSLLMFIMADNNDNLGPARTAEVLAYYYPRKRVL
jgi:hypothetical protein